MSAPSFSELDIDFTPAPAWRFRLPMPALSSGGGSASRLMESGLLVQTVSTPFPAIETEQSPFEAGMRTVPSGWQIDNINAHFLESDQLDVLQYFMSWHYLILDKDGNFGLPGGANGYKKTIVFDPTASQESSVQQLSYTGAWPIRVDSYNYDGSQTAPIIATVTFAIDRPKQLLSGY